MLNGIYHPIVAASQPYPLVEGDLLVTHTFESVEEMYNMIAAELSLPIQQKTWTKQRSKPFSALA
jgi:hypothetical protein